MPQEGWFKKKSFAGRVSGAQATAVPEGVATKCARCGQILFTKDFEKNLKVCPHCGFHHKLTADERIAYTVEPGSFVPMFEGVGSADPLKFPEYSNKLDKSASATGLKDGFRAGSAVIERVPVLLGVTEFLFVGGSMGSAGGEKVVRVMEEAINRRIPLVIFSTSSGARMQEGLLSLMQMAKTSAAAARLAEAGVPYIVVITDPNFGGVFASYASLGDILLSEPGAMMGLAGARVAAQAANQKQTEDYQSAEWQLEHGQIDQIVQRKELPATIASLLTLLGSAKLPDEPDPTESRLLEAAQAGGKNA